MALLAEEIVEEWLNRKGYFTIRGIKLGVHEIDLLALAAEGGSIRARHIEVQASVRPISYFAPLPKEDQRALQRAPHNAAARTPEQMRAGVKEWVDKKYHHREKEQLRQALYRGKWEFELVVHKLKYPEEVPLIEEHHIRVWRLADIVADMSSPGNLVKSAAGTDLLDLVMLQAR